MKKAIYHIITLVCAATVLALASCSADEDSLDVREGAVVYPKISVSVSSMSMSASTRAISPMDPDEEKAMETLAIFEFDNEGFHKRGDNTFHFIDFTKGTVDGKAGVGNIHQAEFGVVETTLDGLSFEEYSGATLCLVANVTMTDIDDFYETYREPNQSSDRTTLVKFKQWALKINYLKSDSVGYDESVSGHIKDMYMFGYYEGPIDPANPGNISVDIGRLVSRLDITIVNKTGRDITKRLGYHFDNVPEYAYFFPLLLRMPPVLHAGLARTVICAGDNPVAGDTDQYTIVPRAFPNDSTHTRYYYIAAHSAEGYDEATKLHLFYDREVPDSVTDDYTNTTAVPLCNVRPQEAGSVDNGYSLSRNTRYSFTIYLRSSSTAPAIRRRTSRLSAVEYGDNPGEITIYLPD